jgi:hypothetical protein
MKRTSLKILWGGGQRPSPSQSEVAITHCRDEEPTAIRTNLGAVFVSLELSRSIWLITSVSPGGGEKMSKHSVSAGDTAALLTRFSELVKKAFAQTGKSFPIIVIQEAELDGFWIHRALQREGIESYVVDAASIATSRRRRRAKTDRIDGEALVRALLAYKRGEPRVCAMVRAPTPATSTGFGAGALVPCTSPTQWWTPAEDDDCRACAQAARRAVEICDRWCRH